MGKEAQFWSDVVRPALSPHGRLVRIENVLDTGTPDVAYTLRNVDGWIELKDLDGWPARADSVVRIDHYTPDQRQWHNTWRAAGGRCAVLVRVRGHGVVYDSDLRLVSPRAPDAFFLFDALAACAALGLTWTRHEWYVHAHWSGAVFDGFTVVQHLTGM